MDWNQWIAPAIVAAIVSGAISIIGMFVNRNTTIAVNKEKIDADLNLAEKKFDFDKDLSNRKFELEKAQLVHKRRFELAESLLADTYRFQELMRYVRNGGSFGGEGETRITENNETDNEKRMKNSYFVPIERLQKENDFNGSFFSKQYAAQAQFGTEMAQAFMLFSQVIIEIRTASRMLIEGVGRYNEDLEFTNHLLEQIWAGYSTVRKKEDVIAKKIIDGIAIFEKLCKPVLEWKGA